MRRVLIAVLILVLPTAVALIIYFWVKPGPVITRRDAVGSVITVAGTGAIGFADGPRDQAVFADPFGIAIDRRGNLVIAEGGNNNRVRRVTPQGSVETIAGSQEGFADGIRGEAQFHTPSGIAVDSEGNILLADTGNNRVRRLTPQGEVTTVAGAGEPGFRDGPGADALFDGPVAIAIDNEGNIIIADTYNDRIRKVGKDGSVTTVAGAGKAGYLDGPAGQAMFDTPAGVAVDRLNNLYVADTGNDSIRKITPEGEVSTLAFAPEGEPGGGLRLKRPVGIAASQDGFLFITCEGSGQIVRVTPEGQFDLYAGERSGFSDGVAIGASFNGPTGIAIDNDGIIYVADTQNRVIRAIRPVDPLPERLRPAQEAGPYIQPGANDSNDSARLNLPIINHEEIAPGGRFPWPLSPQEGWHEVTGVVGEARGAPGGVALHHLHSGLDVRGNMGDPVVSVLDEKASAPIPAWSFGGDNEGITLGLMSYVHLRVGRDRENRQIPGSQFKAEYDSEGNVSRIRVRRGARFRVGEVVGTLNRLFHVHMNLGPWNAQANPIALPFTGFKDTAAPIIEPGGVEVSGAAGQVFKEKENGRLVITGDVDIIVTVYDTADGIGAGRKLGIYKAGYQVLDEAGNAVAGFEQPIINIEFNRLPPGDEPVFIVYAEGSGVSAYGTPTKFKYIVTNWVRDGRARDGLLRTSALAPGNYIIRAHAEDHAGNTATGPATELAVTIR
ncbi:MAG TPA: NHL repeat-containing protein [Blastocatellia bacterium]|jgi:sugar lactone lactonase YvrE